MSTHLDALELRLSHERVRLAEESSASKRALRAVWIAQIEKEIACEKTFLGITAHAPSALSDDDLLRELAS
jgi:hypothetical protein